MDHLERCYEYAFPRTLCLVRVDDDDIEGVATGLAFAAGERVFLVTAGHVIERHRPEQDLLFVAPLEGVKGLLLIEAERAIRTLGRDGRPGGDDPHDLAVLPLRGESVPRVRAAVTNLRATDLDDRGSNEAYYMCLGFPSGEVEFDLVTKTFTTVARPYFAPGLGRNIRLPKARSPLGVRLRFSKSRLMRTDGQRTNARDFRGMSGSGVWRVIGPGGKPEFPPPLVGILHTLGRAALAAGVPVVVAALEHYFSGEGQSQWRYPPPT